MDDSLSLGCAYKERKRLRCRFFVLSLAFQEMSLARYTIPILQSAALYTTDKFEFTEPTLGKLLRALQQIDQKTSDSDLQELVLRQTLRIGPEQVHNLTFESVMDFIDRFPNRRFNLQISFNLPKLYDE